jgi:septal ring factor EnvC (AmiA/AmiB activator)
MRCVQLVGFISLMLVSTAWAGSDQSDQSKPLPAGHAATSLSQVRQRLTRNQTEVKRQEQDVARQESDSKRASERLRQQDQAIVELQKQLQELRATPAPAQHQGVPLR